MTGIFLRATVVTRGWNGYRNKSQHRKSTLEKKILPPFQQGFEPATFQSRVRRSNHWAIPAPWGREDACGWLSVALGLPASTEPVGLLGTGAQDGHLDFHTAQSWAALHVRAKRAGFDAS